VLDVLEIQEEAGRGAIGVVYRARDRRTGETVAVKVFGAVTGATGDPAEREAQQQRWRREADLLQSLSHPNIVAVRGWILDGEQAGLITEFVEGGSLERLLEERGALPVEQALTIVSQAARALAHAHGRGILHRDVKPANLLLTADGTVKLTDFGVAAAPPESDPGMLEGTPAYMAPEQLLGQPGDARSDVYALGAVLYRCLTGRLPHRATSIRELTHRALHDDPEPPSRWRAGLAPELEAACMTALARRPEQRFESGIAFARRLEEIAVPPGAPAEEVRPPRRTLRERALERTWSPERGRDARGPWISSAVVLAIAVLGAAWWSRPAVSPPLDRRVGRAHAVVPPGFPAAPAPPSEAPVAAPPTLAQAAPSAPADPGRAVAAPAGTAFEPPARPRPAEATWRLTDERPLPAARGEVELQHGLRDGVLEVRIDERRVVRQALAAPRPGRDAVGRASFEVSPGIRRVSVRVRSKSQNVDTESLWLGEWAEHGTRTLRFTLAREGNVWRLQDGS
jgi:serine/threonine-protein kinase